MKARLQIKNFGPIKDIDIEISRFNILIGPHASGKSTIAKILSVIHAFADYFSPGYRPFREKFLSDELFSEDGKYKLLKELLNYYKLDNFLKRDSHWIFEDERFSFEFNGKHIEVSHKKDQNANRSQ
jgi:predicted ATPase